MRYPSILGILGVVFVILKLTGSITWSWLWVLLPFWLIPIFWVAIFIFLVVVVMVSD